MIRPATPGFFSWILTIVVHELVLLAALTVESEELHYYPVDPDLHCALVQRMDRFGFERIPDGFGRWPRECAHLSLLRAVRHSEDGMLEDIRCERCGRPWWDIQANPWD